MPVSPFFDWGRTYKFVVFLSFFLAFHESLSLINWFCHFINRFPNKWWSTQCLFVKKKVEIPHTTTHTHLSYSVRDRSRFGLSKFISCKKALVPTFAHDQRLAINDQRPEIVEASFVLFLDPSTRSKIVSADFSRLLFFAKKLTVFLSFRFVWVLLFFSWCLKNLTLLINDDQ